MDTLHKNAFRVTYDLLNNLWPPENSVEYFERASKLCALAYGTTLADNELGKAFVNEVYQYLMDTAQRGETQCRTSEEQLSIV